MQEGRERGEGRGAEEGRGEEGVVSLVGVDVGGTHIRAGVLDVDGHFLSKVELLTEARRGPAAVLSSIQHAVEELRRRGHRLDAVGIACAGQIDPATGTVVEAPNLGWQQVPLATTLATALGLRVVVENDVRAAAWGEFRAGAGQGGTSLVAVFVGTGVGSGAVLGGRLWRGAGNAAGEVGHTQVVPDGLPCRCGRRGCLEQYVSGSGFQRRLRAALDAGVTTVLADRTAGDAEELSASMVEQAAVAGDEFAGAVWADAVQYLTLGVANYVTIVNPSVLVLGGGVIETVPPLFEAVARGVPELTTVLARRSLRIERARLGDWSGVVGAAALAADALAA